MTQGKCKQVSFRRSIINGETTQVHVIRHESFASGDHFTCCCLCCKFDGGSYGIISRLHIGRRSKKMTCLNCRNVIQTERRYISSKKTHLLAGLLSLVCCCILPYYFNIFRHVKHHCPVCKAYIGFSK